MRIDEFALGVSPRAAELRALRGTIGSSDVRMTGSVDNLLGFAIGEGELSGRASLDSDRFDLDEWRSDDSLAVILVPPRIDFVLRTAIAQLHHARLDMTNARGVVRVRDQRLTIDSLRLNAVGGEFRLAGWYETIDPAKPAFDIDVGITNASVAESFEALTTVQLLAPVARYAEGRFSTSLQLNGALGGNMMPDLTALTGRGTLETTQVALQEFPPMNRLADALDSGLLRNPALRAIRTAIVIDDGRLHVRPFDVGIGASTLTVGGSNGLDRSLDYDLVLALPQSALESGAREVVGNLFSRAGVAGAVLDTVSVVRVAVKLTGTIDDPSISLDVGRGVT
ncbi:MAG TPA: AsmA-like C-terminal region-containing protein, partial [Gammaproteobacteria bacterium]|nr:AsmA-like C-terminal region-containing protein [Gammaproteobacteria bacterium]